MPSKQSVTRQPCIILLGSTENNKTFALFELLKVLKILSTYLIANKKWSAKTEDILFALFPDINMREDSFINLPCYCQMIWTLVYMEEQTQNHINQEHLLILQL